ncbi:T9SS type A sorting domain-containing protein [uncultured Flavobacterium sp.]|uniref:T9SS type A sorting domain-containing protein n=1 Tax=uncultured Flavobacterium sp. TaxID=165435 RepID=UPI0030C83C09
MRNLSLLFLIIFNYSFSQTYTPLLDQTNQWHFTSCNFGCITDVYYTDGDTLVNGVSHKILDGFHYISRTFLLKEDVVAKKVYLTKINTNSISEYLLYDFSLNEGDTFNMVNPISPFPQNGGSFILDSIRMKPLLNNVNYKHFYFSPTATNTISSANVVWVEGMGSKSLINAPAGEVNINGAGQLSCFFKNSNLVYSQLDSISACNFVLKKETFNNVEIKLFKKDFKNQFILSNSSSINKIELYSLKGDKLNLIIDKNDNSIIFSLENYPKGLYFITAFDDFNRKKTFKILVE